MSVNQVNQAAGIQAEGELSALNNELTKIANVRNSDKSSRKSADSAKADEARHTARAQQKTAKARSKSDTGTRILASLAGDLAKAGVVLPKTINRAVITKEMEEALGKSKLNDEDAYSVRNTSTQDAVKNIRKRKQQNQEQKQEGKDGKKEQFSEKAKGFAQDYAQAYAGYAASASPEAKSTLDELRRKLGEEGFSDRDIAVIERGTRKALRGDMISNIQSSFFRAMLSPEKSFDLVVASKQYKHSLEYAVNNLDDFGSYDAEGIKEYVNSMISDSNGDLKDFINAHLKEKLLEKDISQKNVKDDVTRLVTLGYKVGFDFEGFMNSWQQKKVDLGIVAPELFASNKPDSGKVKVAIEGASAGGVSERHQYTMTLDEEKEVLSNRLRALYMKKALSGNMFEDIEVRVKIRKTKNGMIKLGLTYEDLHMIEREGIGLARMRSLEQLKAAFMERSTFFKLSGSAYDLVNKKIKGLVSNIKKLGLDLSQRELDILRDDANRQMYDHTVIELKWALAALKKGPDPKLHKKAILMTTLLVRLSGESGFDQAHGEDIEALLYSAENQLKTTKGSA
ncbi:hypothetical protein ACFLZ2_05610 [Candidatus Margulisiibacteriota bacterium]